MKPLEWNPNQRYVYSDLGLIILGEIIEQVSGQRIDTYVRSQLHYPMGMFSTFFTPKKVGNWYSQSIPLPRWIPSLEWNWFKQMCTMKEPITWMELQAMLVCSQIV